MLEKRLTPYEKHIIHKRTYLLRTDTPFTTPFVDAMNSLHPFAISNAVLKQQKGIYQQIRLDPQQKRKVQTLALQYFKRRNTTTYLEKLLYPVIMYVNNNLYKEKELQRTKPPHLL